MSKANYILLTLLNPAKQEPQSGYLTGCKIFYARGFANKI